MPEKTDGWKWVSVAAGLLSLVGAAIALGERNATLSTVNDKIRDIDGTFVRKDVQAAQFDALFAQIGRLDKKVETMDTKMDMTNDKINALLRGR